MLGHRLQVRLLEVDSGRERLAATPDLDWDGFAAAHPELFETPSLLTSYYSEECLASARARHTFVLPDRRPSML